MDDGTSLVFDRSGVPFSLEISDTCSVQGGYPSLRDILDGIASSQDIIDEPANYEALAQALRDVGLLHAAATPSTPEIQGLAREAFDRGLLRIQPHVFDFRPLCDIHQSCEPEPLITEGPWEGELLEAAEEEDIYLIVVGDRPVQNTLGMAYHYSLELWKARPGSIPIGENFDRPDFESQYAGSQFIEGVELLRDGDWRVYEYDDDQWDEEGVAVSVISYDPKSTNVMPILRGDEATVSATWAKALGAAKSYGFAEQKGFDGEFQNWPNSRYEIYTFDEVNNSNTFVRWLVDTIGLTMSEMTGPHPGRMQPVVEKDYQYSPKPWPKGETAPAAPSSPPPR